ncbi:hypothetical protein [Yinghuangia seranimata]|uniref:hypothetical protein n=1 Tax=Yinghuangia seranimata TaxID=408067 RepID=UPI00248AC8A0|nr:hypothetical protein [Yinghuangia seranimata]MDI2127970.1 hypothetical protein [Yinghuangia seranimata]
MYLVLALVAPLVMFGLIPGLAWFEERMLGPGATGSRTPAPGTQDESPPQTADPTPPPVLVAAPDPAPEPIPAPIPAQVLAAAAAPDEEPAADVPNKPIRHRMRPVRRRLRGLRAA